MSAGLDEYPGCQRGRPCGIWWTAELDRACPGVGGKGLLRAGGRWPSDWSNGWGVVQGVQVKDDDTWDDVMTPRRETPARETGRWPGGAGGRCAATERGYRLAGMIRLPGREIDQIDQIAAHSAETGRSLHTEER